MFSSASSEFFCVLSSNLSVVYFSFHIPEFDKMDKSITEVNIINLSPFTLTFNPAADWHPVQWKRCDLGPFYAMQTTQPAL